MEIMTKRDVADFLKVGLRTVERYMALAGDPLPSFRYQEGGSSGARFVRSKVEEWALRRTEG